MDRCCSANHEWRNFRKSGFPVALQFFLCPGLTLIRPSAPGHQEKATIDFAHEKRQLARTLNS